MSSTVTANQDEVDRQWKEARDKQALVNSSKISATDIASQRRARTLEANSRGVPAQTIGRGAATMFSPSAGTSATKTLLGQ